MKKDSRSNVNFEVGLYYTWGKQLYSKKDYMAAFTVFADGYYRYPDNEDFLNNTFTTFYKSLRRNWHRKNWPESARLIEEMIDLEILQERDHRAISQYLANWRNYFNAKNNKQSSDQVKYYLKKFND